MKFALLSVLFLLVSCAPINKELESAISYGEIKELNQYSSEIEKQLYVRLYQSPIYKQDCFKETHGVCQYRYYLSVSTFDEYPETNIFPLSNVGEVTGIEWQDSKEIDTAIIDFAINNYTKAATANNPNLTSRANVVRITVTPKSIEEALTKSSSGR